MLGFVFAYYMATADTPAGDSGPKCARDFVEEKLQEADSPMSPAELAEEYGCTNGHVRNLLSDLRDEEVVQRVGHGQYEAAPDDSDGETADLSADLQPESEGNAQATTEASEPDETPQETSEPVAGPARLEDRDTEDLERQETGESGGVPVPVSGKAIVVATALLLLLVLWRSRSSSSSPSSSSEVVDDSDEDEGVRVPLWE